MGALIDPITNILLHKIIRASLAKNTMALTPRLNACCNALRELPLHDETPEWLIERFDLAMDDAMDAAEAATQGETRP